MSDPTPIPALDNVCTTCQPFLPGLTQTLSSILSTLETNIAFVFTTASTVLHYLGHHLSSAPLSSTLTSQSTRFNLWYTNLDDHLFIPLAIFFSAFLAYSVFLFFTLFARYYFGVDPFLAPFPLPFAIYDPYADEQSNSFADRDVCPQLVEEPSDQTLYALNPSTEDTLGYIPTDSALTVDQAVARAREVQPIWAATTFAERRSVMRTLLNHILHEQKRLCEISRRDSGKTLLDASLGEIIPTLEKLRWVIAEGEAALVPDRRTVGPMTIHKKATVEYMPLGVIAAIAPWNYPLHNLLNPVIAALFAGNAIVVKPSEHTSWSSLYFARMVRRTLTLCGYSPELMQLVIGDGAVGRALVNSDIDKLFFTGSTEVGKMVALAAAKRLLPVVLELGGKDPFIVCDDADVKHAATICLRGVFQNAGQNCIAVERVFVHDKVMDEFTSHVVAGAKAIRLGVDMGAMTMGEAALESVKELVDDAVEQGADLLVGGKLAKVNGKGFFFEPTVLNGVTPRMRIAKEEVFGPVLTLLSWNNDHELVRMVNSCSLGLGSSVYSSDRRRADKILGALRVGMGNVNDFATNYLCQSMPFGGTKESGSDKFAGIEGLRGCCIAKAITRDRIPGVRTNLPKAFQYPTRANAFELSAEISDLVFAKGVMVKLDNIRNLLGMFIRPRWRPRTTASG